MGFKCKEYIYFVSRDLCTRCGRVSVYGHSLLHSYMPGDIVCRALQCATLKNENATYDDDYGDNNGGDDYNYNLQFQFL